jgi:hypothetical protein
MLTLSDEPQRVRPVVSWLRAVERATDPVVGPDEDRFRFEIG